MEWLGKIPTHWEIKKLKFLSKKILGGGTPDSTNSIYWTDNLDDGYLWVSIEDISNSEMITETKKYISKTGLKNCSAKIIKPYSILYSIYASLGKVAYSKKFLTTNQAILSIEFQEEYYYKYMFYYLKTLTQIATALSNSTTQNNISLSILKSLQCAIPPKDEQTKIASFLDEKTTQINQAIAQKERLVELLKEKKQITINDAVTKGLDKNTPLKDSGVEWIGKIPEHWEIQKLFGLCKFIRGNSNFSKDELLNNGKYVALQYGKIYKVDEVDERYKFYVNDEFYKSSQIVNFGDTIFISTSETIEDLGHSAYYKRSDLGLLGGEQILLNPKIEIIDSKYLYFSSKVFSKELQRFATGIKVFRFNVNDLKTIYMPIPPKEEQIQIVEYLQNQTTQIDKAIQLQQNYIVKLKEYKASLIDSVVRGKVRVG